MNNQKASNTAKLLPWVLVISGISIGILYGFLAGTVPIYLLALLVGGLLAALFFVKFDVAVIGLLVIRSSLDAFSDLQVPSALGLATIIFSICYVIIALLTQRPIRTDKFWWFFLAWMFLQAVWIILLPLDALGFDTSLLMESIYEWLRLFTWVIVYFLVMQLSERIPAEKILNLLFFSLCFPLFIATMQLFARSLLPTIFVHVASDSSLAEASGTRAHATFAHPNSFATYLLIFLGLTWWKFNQSKPRWPWAVLIGVLVFFVVGTKAIFILGMLGVTVIILIIPKLNLTRIIGAFLLFTVIIGLFTSTEFGQQRLQSIYRTPLLNPHIDTSKAILLSQGDFNSFNWRIAQWYRLTKAWENYPVLGYGIGLSYELGDRRLLPHNDYLRAMVEEGIIGLILFVIFLVAQVGRLVWLIKIKPGTQSQQQLRFILLSILLSMLLGMCTDNLWSNTAAYFYWWAIFAIVGWNWSDDSTAITGSHQPKLSPKPGSGLGTPSTHYLLPNRTS